MDETKAGIQPSPCLSGLGWRPWTAGKMCAQATGSVEGASIGSTWNPSGVPCFFPAALGRPVERQAVPPPEGVSAALRTPGSWSLLRLTGAELEAWSIYQKRLPPLMIFIVSFVNKECFYVAWLLHRFVTYQVLWDTSPLPPPPNAGSSGGVLNFPFCHRGEELMTYGGPEPLKQIYFHLL